MIEFVLDIDTNGAGDYSTVQAAESDIDAITLGLTSNQVLVYPYSSIVGTQVDPGDSLDGSINGYTCTCITWNDSYVLVEHDSPSENFVNSEQLQINGSHYIQLTSGAGSGYDQACVTYECRDSSGGTVTSDAPLVMSDITASATYFFTVKAADGHAASTSFSTSKYYIEVASGENSHGIYCNCSYTVIDGIQIDQNSSSTTRHGIVFYRSGGAVDTIAQNCYCRSDGSSSSGNGYDNSDSSTTSQFINCIAHGFSNIGFYPHAASGGSYIVNCTAYGNGVYGFSCGYGRGTVYGSVGSNSGTLDFNTDAAVDWGSDTDYNVSADGSAANVGGSNYQANATINFTSSTDFSITSGSDCDDFEDATYSRVPSTDIDGTTRGTSTCDAGVYELVSGGLTATPSTHDVPAIVVQVPTSPQNIFAAVDVIITPYDATIPAVATTPDVLEAPLPEVLTPTTVNAVPDYPELSFDFQPSHTAISTDTIEPAFSVQDATQTIQPVSDVPAITFSVESVATIERQGVLDVSIDPIGAAQTIQHAELLEFSFLADDVVFAATPDVLEFSIVAGDAQNAIPDSLSFTIDPQDPISGVTPDVLEFPAFAPQVPSTTNVGGYVTQTFLVPTPGTAHSHETIAPTFEVLGAVTIEYAQTLDIVMSAEDGQQTVHYGEIAEPVFGLLVPSTSNHAEIVGDIAFEPLEASQGPQRIVADIALVFDLPAPSVPENIFAALEFSISAEDASIEGVPDPVEITFDFPDAAVGAPGSLTNYIGIEIKIGV